MQVGTYPTRNFAHSVTARQTTDDRCRACCRLGQSFLLTSACRHADRTVSSLRLATQAWRTVSEDSGSAMPILSLDAGSEILRNVPHKASYFRSPGTSYLRYTHRALTGYASPWSIHLSTAPPVFPADCLHSSHCHCPSGRVARDTQIFQHIARFY